MRRTASLPEVEGVLSAREVEATVETIAAAQLPDGNIPWFPGHHTDPWNLVEAAMALDVGGRSRDAERAYEWLRSMQREDGAWHAYYDGRRVTDATLDTNVSSYVAVGIWHHYLSTDDRGFLEEFWDVVRRAVEFALAHQLPDGPIAWCAGSSRDPSPGALLTASSSVHAALRSAIAIAGVLGQEQPDWELSLASLATAITEQPHRFLDKDRWAMDWYYPVLGGALDGDGARTRIAHNWQRFVAPGRGVRCVADHPWVTTAETCELVLVLNALDLDREAHQLFAWIQFLRTDSGHYWTGSNFEGDRFERDGALFPLEQSTWNAAAVVLAASALDGRGPAAEIFRGSHRRLTSDQNNEVSTERPGPTARGPGRLGASPSRSRSLLLPDGSEVHDVPLTTPRDHRGDRERGAATIH